MSDRSEKQFTVDDWVNHIKNSKTHCKRSVENAMLKKRGGHPLSTSEHNLLEGYERFLLTSLKYVV
ncbi:MAG: hypothetical protein ACXADL_14370 [Candidatus Thorarchaeota archaeon]|jgi:hypothetical protein